MAQPPTTSTALLARLGNLEDGGAWEEFVAVYGSLVRRAARRRGVPAADVEDVAQEVFRAVARAFEGGLFDPAKGSFRRWLFRVARNEAVSFLVALGREPRGTGDTDVRRLLEALPAADPADPAAVEAECRRELLRWAAERVRGEFTDLCWRAFWETGVEGRPAGEVAGELGTTVGTVYHYKSRVMARLRREVERVEGGA